MTSLMGLKGPSDALCPWVPGDLPLAEQPWLSAVGLLKWPGVRTPKPGAASAGSVQMPASWGGLSLSWALTVSLSRGMGEEDLKSHLAPPLAGCLTSIIFLPSGPLLANPSQVAAIFGLDPRHQPPSKFYLLPFLPCLPPKSPGN